MPSMAKYQRIGKYSTPLEIMYKNRELFLHGLAVTALCLSQTRAILWHPDHHSSLLPPPSMSCLLLSSTSESSRLSRAISYRLQQRSLLSKPREHIHGLQLPLPCQMCAADLEHRLKTSWEGGTSNHSSLPLCFNGLLNAEFSPAAAKLNLQHTFPTSPHPLSKVKA